MKKSPPPLSPPPVLEMGESKENTAMEIVKGSGRDGGGVASILPKYSKHITTETGARGQIPLRHIKYLIKL
jgi:hypothetical protein